MVLNEQEGKEFIGLEVPANLKAALARLAAGEGLVLSAFVRRELILLVKQRQGEEYTG